jgi:RNA polymerase sigma factor (TIGR02999 family)
MTRLLVEASAGDRQALDRLIPVVYGELRRLAHGYLQNERAGHTLQTTALVHEAYLRLVDQKHLQWQNRTHFFAIAARIMREILTEHARSRGRAKRGGGAVKFSLDEAPVLSDRRAAELVALDDALRSLETIAPRKSRVVELRFFGGLTNEEVAEVLEISPRTVRREWNLAQAWLYREMNREEAPR